jgi:hypothetical protein
MRTIDKQELLKAAKAIQAAQGAREMKEATDEQLEQFVRSSPLWATIPNAPAAGEPLTDEQLEQFARACQIAEALGIES